MEPQYMIIGQAAGVAAGMAIRQNAPVQQVDSKALTAELKRKSAVIEYVPSPQQFIYPQIRKAAQ